HGHVPRRYRDAGHRGAALHPAGEDARLRPRLVRHPVHDHLPDRVYNASLRLQSIPDARDGAARSDPRRHLPLDRSILLPDGADDHHHDDLSADRAVAAFAVQGWLKMGRWTWSRSEIDRNMSCSARGRNGKFDTGTAT